MKYCYLIMLLLVEIPLSGAQQKKAINWKSWSQLENALLEEPKPVFIFFHAEWCDYCKKIEREIFTNPAVISKINADYYAVEMDVETTDTITFEGVDFINKQALTMRNGIHEIPLLLASREGFSFSLPATVVLNKDFTLKDRHFEYYTSKELLEFL